jgi:hypothetical protein
LQGAYPFLLSLPTEQIFAVNHRRIAYFNIVAVYGFDDQPDQIAMVVSMKLVDFPSHGGRQMDRVASLFSIFRASAKGAL